MSSAVCRLSALLAFLVPLTALAVPLPERFAVTNVTSDNATVVWLSNQVEVGRVEFAETESDLRTRSGTFAAATDDA
ncbi:MAG: hypothetical protein HY814_14005, partial [Candidatus Riflebacteria bacterium]|nr:hypothetical protein [Candidatus Riflebacteria bacterium]